MYDTLIEEFNGEETRTRVPDDGIQKAIAEADPAAPTNDAAVQPVADPKAGESGIDETCLLYTSDAADE